MVVKRERGREGGIWEGIKGKEEGRQRKEMEGGKGEGRESKGSENGRTEGWAGRVGRDQGAK